QQRLVEARVGARGVLDQQRVAVRRGQGLIRSSPVRRQQALGYRELGGDRTRGAGLEGQTQGIHGRIRALEGRHVLGREAHVLGQVDEACGRGVYVAGSAGGERRIGDEAAEAAAQHG